MEELSRCTGFQWDEGNADKNWERHRVSRLECEQPFFSEPFLVYAHKAHSLAEKYNYALGETDRGRKLFIVFTVGDDLVRVISARDVRRREREHSSMPKKEGRAIPEFSSEEEERVFWSENDSAEYIDWRKAQEIRFPNLKPSTKVISIRFPESLLEELKVLANKRDVPYQSLLKIFVAERVDEEIRGKR